MKSENGNTREDAFAELHRKINVKLDKCVDDILLLCADDPLDGDSTEHIMAEFLEKLDYAMGNT